MRTTILAVLSIAAAALGGCAGGRLEPGPSATAQGSSPHLADGRRPEGMCLWAKTGGYRTCLIHSAGKCGVYGDPCTPLPTSSPPP